VTLVTLPYRTQLAGGQPEDIGKVLANFDAILAAFNGDIRDDNLASVANIAISKLAGFPNDVTKQLLGNGTWAALAEAGPTQLKKTTTKSVTNNTETDLLNSEFNVLANTMGTDKVLSAVLLGDSINNSGANQGTAPRWRLKFGGTTLLDSGAPANTNVWPVSAVRWPYVFLIWVTNNAATNVQTVALIGLVTNVGQAATSSAQVAFTTGIGYYTWLSGGSGVHQGHALLVGLNSGAIDTTANKLLEFTVQLPATASNLDARLLRAQGVIQ